MATVKTSRVKPFKKAGFPLGIFLLVFVIDSAAVSAGVAAYFYRTVKKEIAIIESYTRNFAVTMGESFADVCELSYRHRDFTNARLLFHEKIREGTVDEAFFVLENSKIVLHSQSKAVNRVRGNIANDEFYYNTELILRPLKTKSTKIQLTPYNLIERTIPFTRQEREFIRKYLYPDIDKNGWLVSRAVFHKGVPVGTVNFLIGKEPIHKLITSRYNSSVALLARLAAGVFFIALALSLIVWYRYRRLQARALMAGEGATEGIARKGTRVTREEPALAPLVDGNDRAASRDVYILKEIGSPSAVDESGEFEEIIDIEIMGDIGSDGGVEVYDIASDALPYPVTERENRFDHDRVVMDAIPVMKEN